MALAGALAGLAAAFLAARAMRSFLYEVSASAPTQTEPQLALRGEA
jgi:hypothetical protein